MSECTACKIIINSGLLPGPAGVLASIATGDMSAAARELAATASALDKMYSRAVDFGVIKPVDPAHWQGCDEVGQVLEWTRAIRRADTAINIKQAVAAMRKWSASMIDVMDLIRAGKLTH